MTVMVAMNLFFVGVVICNSIYKPFILPNPHIETRKNMAGITTIAKRSAENNIGGNSSRPNLTIVKFTPQMMITKMANMESLNVIGKI